MEARAVLAISGLALLLLPGCVEPEPDLEKIRLPSGVLGTERVSMVTVNDGGGILEVEWQLRYRTGYVVEEGKERVEPGEDHRLGLHLNRSRAHVLDHVVRVAGDPRTGSLGGETLLYPPECERRIVSTTLHVTVDAGGGIHGTGSALC